MRRNILQICATFISCAVLAYACGVGEIGGDSPGGGTRNSASADDAGSASGSTAPVPDAGADADAPAPDCPKELTKCGVLGELAVCCRARADCAADGRSCKSSGGRCGELNYECGSTCCPATQRCDEANSRCISRCDDGKVECATAAGALGCCPAGTQCSITHGATGYTYRCIRAPRRSRCRAPQYACVNGENDASLPYPRTACCNPGTTCSTNGAVAGCCPPGSAVDPNDQSKCKPLGPQCGEHPCLAGQVCCDHDQDGDGTLDKICVAGTDQKACDNLEPAKDAGASDGGDDGGATPSSGGGAGG